MDQFNLFSGEAEPAKSITDVDDKRKPKAQREFKIVPLAESQAILARAILNGTHSVERKHYCKDCGEWVDSLFYLDVYAVPRKMICRSCAAKRGVEGASDKESQVGTDLIMPTVSEAVSLPEGVTRVEEIGLPDAD